MAFLIGSFGDQAYIDNLKELTQSVLKKMMLVATHHVKLPHGVLYAGQSKHLRPYNHILPLAQEGGILVGKLFDRTNDTPITTHHDSAQRWPQNPALLYQQAWGRFVGALYNNITHQLSLVRDPLGLSTLFYYQQSKGIIFSTDIALIYAILKEKPALDLDYFAQHIINKNQAPTSTPFVDIKELLPGVALTTDTRGNNYQHYMWNLASLQGTPITDEREREERLLARLTSSMRAWTHDSDGICLELSGGLDSSATLIVLQKVLPADKRLIAVNFIDSKTPSSNEHTHAQEVADMCGVPLHLMDLHGASLISELPSEWRPNRPSTFLLCYGSTRELQSFMQEQRCHELANGQGGDHVFLAPPPIEVVADYWLNKGFTGIGTPLKNIGATYRTSWSSIAYHALKSVLGYYRGAPIQSAISTPFLTPEYAHALAPQEFYLRTTLRNFHPARAAQIEGLAHAIAYADRDQRCQNTVVLHPLLSLPIVEEALNIPTYQSFDQTYDRIFLRRTVSKIRPSKSLWRTLKGQTTGTMSKLFAQEAHKVTDILVNGTLVKSGIINRNWLDNELIAIRHGKAHNLWPLLHLLASQVWIDQWRL